MKWEPVDLIVIIMIAVLLILVLATIGARLLGIEALGSEAIKTLSNFNLSVIAIVALYVGSRLNGRSDDK